MVAVIPYKCINAVAWTGNVTISAINIIIILEHTMHDCSFCYI